MTRTIVEKVLRTLNYESKLYETHKHKLSSANLTLLEGLRFKLSLHVSQQLCYHVFLKAKDLSWNQKEQTQASPSTTKSILNSKPIGKHKTEYRSFHSSFKAMTSILEIKKESGVCT